MIEIKKPPCLRLLPLVAISMCLWLTSPALAQGNAACPTVDPDQAPSWVDGAVWAGVDGDVLFLVDPPHRILLGYEKGTGPARAPSGSAARTLDQFQVIGIRPLEKGGLVAEAPGGYLMQWDKNLRAAGPVPAIYDVKSAAGVQGYFPHKWAVEGDGLEDGTLVVCADVQQEVDGDWVSGIFRIKPSASGGSLTPLIEFDDIGDPRRLACRISGEKIAVVRKEAYALVMAEQPQIYRLEEEQAVALDLRPRPKPMQVRPALPTAVMRAEYDDLMREVEASTMPVELVAWKDRLYLVMRQPSEDQPGVTEWSLARIDPKEGRVEAVLEIGSRANHLTTVPGSPNWAFIEKGEVISLGEEPIEGFRLVPANRIATLPDGAELCP